MLFPRRFSINLTFTSKEGLKSLSLERNFDGVSRCNEGSFWSGCPTAGETEACPECCEITARKALLWKRFISRGVMAVFLWVSSCLTGCSGVFGFRFTPFVVPASKLCSRDLKWKEVIFFFLSCWFSCEFSSILQTTKLYIYTYFPRNKPHDILKYIFS